MYLGNDAQVSSAVQERCRHVSVPLPGRQVQRRVAGASGGVWTRSVGQQLLDDILFAQTAGDVQRRLVVLATPNQTRGFRRRREQGTEAAQPGWVK